MPKGLQGQKRPADVNAAAVMIGRTPAMAAGLTTAKVEMAELVALIDAAEMVAIGVKRRAMLEAVPHSN
jgi:hypothetical protein